MLLHPKIVANGVLFGIRHRIKTALHLHRKPRAHVLEAGVDKAVERHTRICRTLLGLIPPGALEGVTVAEVGCGDCLAAADMMLGLGARHVHLVEGYRVEISEKHRLALEPLVADVQLPNRGDILLDEHPPRLDPRKATFHQALFEQQQLQEPVDFLYSFDVLEHVEDLDEFFRYCAKTVKKGGFMVHKFDLSGHEFFEDPMPPLDFQTYPNWLYELIFPKYRRAVRHFADEFTTAMTKHGFGEFTTLPLRVADPQYVTEIYPRLRPQARQRSKETLQILDVAISCRRL